jgi:hypothetical protein
MAGDRSGIADAHADADADEDRAVFAPSASAWPSAIPDHPFGTKRPSFLM